MNMGQDNSAFTCVPNPVTKSCIVSLNCIIVSQSGCLCSSLSVSLWTVFRLSPVTLHHRLLLSVPLTITSLHLLAPFICVCAGFYLFFHFLSLCLYFPLLDFNWIAVLMAYQGCHVDIYWGTLVSVKACFCWWSRSIISDFGCSVFRDCLSWFLPYSHRRPLKWLCASYSTFSLSHPHPDVWCGHLPACKTVWWKMRFTQSEVGV